MSSLSSSSTAATAAAAAAVAPPPTTTTTDPTLHNVPQCLAAIIGVPLELLFVAWVVGRQQGKRRGKRRHYQRQNRHAGADAEGNNDDSDDDDDFMYAHEKGVYLLTLIGLAAQGLFITGIAALRSDTAIDDVLALLAVGAYLVGVIWRPMWVSAMGVPVLVALALRRFVGTAYDPQGNVRSIDQWAVHMGYGTQTIGGDDVPIVAKIAALVDATTCGLLIPIVLTWTYHRVFSRMHILPSCQRLRLSLKSRGRKGQLEGRWWGRWLGFLGRKIHGTSATAAMYSAADGSAEAEECRWERVHRLYSRFDANLLAAVEYNLHHPSRATPDGADTLFRRMRRARENRTPALVWLGDDLCLGYLFHPNAAAPLVTLAMLRLFGSMPSLELYLYGTASSLADQRDPRGLEERRGADSSIVTAMDSFFRLLALYMSRRGQDMYVQFIRLFALHVGAFPVSRHGLRSLVQDPVDDARRSMRRGKRSLMLRRLDLTLDQWTCLLRSVPGPHIEVAFFGSDSARRPDPFRALIQAMREDRCAARIRADGVERLPSHVLEEFATVLEQNRSVTELCLGISTHVIVHRPDPLDGGRVTTSYEVADAVAHRILEALARRPPTLDALELHVSVFPPRMWEFFWEGVVASGALNLTSLKLVTGIGRDPGPALPTDAINEDEMVRLVRQNQRLCSFEYLHENAQRTSCAERVRPHLRLNMLRRLVRSLEGERDLDLRRRWFSTLLVRSVLCRNPSWCYHLLQRNAAGDWLERAPGLFR